MSDQPTKRNQEADPDRGEDDEWSLAAPPHPWGSKSHATAAMKPESGIVRIQAHTIRPATPQRTADSRCVAPTPMIEPVIVWVVLTGMPPIAVPSSITAPAGSAQKPPTGRSLVSRIPMVLTMRQRSEER